MKFYLIKSDNLIGLKYLLKNDYKEKIKFVYIDPPYNIKEANVIYKDKIINWNEKFEKRIKLTHELLKKDGILFVQLSDEKVFDAKIILDKIFGKNNFICTFIRRTGKGIKQNSKTVSIEHDYILCYSKNKKLIKFNKKEQTSNQKYKYKDKYFKERGKYCLNKLDRGSLKYSESMDFPIKVPDWSFIYPGGTKEKNGWTWRWNKEKIEWGLKNEFLVFKKNKKGQYSLYLKQYEKVDNKGKKIERAIPYSTILEDYPNTLGNKTIKKIFGNNIFPYSKPVELIEFLLNLVKIEDKDIILDFYAGSGTTGHAAYNYYLKTNKNIECILIQTKEKINIKNKIVCENMDNIFDILFNRLKIITNNFKKVKLKIVELEGMNYPH